MLGGGISLVTWTLQTPRLAHFSCSSTACVRVEPNGDPGEYAFISRVMGTIPPRVFKGPLRVRRAVVPAHKLVSTPLGRASVTLHHLCDGAEQLPFAFFFFFFLRRVDQSTMSRSLAVFLRSVRFIYDRAAHRANPSICAAVRPQGSYVSIQLQYIRILSHVCLSSCHQVFQPM